MSGVIFLFFFPVLVSSSLLYNMWISFRYWDVMRFNAVQVYNTGEKHKTHISFSQCLQVLSSSGITYAAYFYLQLFLCWMTDYLPSVWVLRKIKGK